MGSTLPLGGSVTPEIFGKFAFKVLPSDAMTAKKLASVGAQNVQTGGA